MDEDTAMVLIELRTKMLTASEELLRDMVKTHVPLLPEKASRTAIIMAFEEMFGSVLKEETAMDQLKDLAKHFEIKPTVSEKDKKTEIAPPVTKVTTKVTKDTDVDILKTIRKEFKISGHIGDGQNCIGYTSFLRQLESGAKQGYGERELVDGVIRAILAGSKLRGYLEGREDLSLPKLQAIIRASYKEKSTTELYQELCGLKQNTQESIQDFLFRALELRQKILCAGKESSLPTYDDALVIHQFRHSVSTGIRNDQIRAEAQELLKTFDNDESLIEGMNLIVRRHQEMDLKLRPNKVCSVNSGVTDESSVLKELKEIRLEINELKAKQSNDRKYVKPRARSCEHCIRNKQNCRHCWNCGAGDHISRNCPKNDSRSAAQGGR